ncbi:death-associated inhibitor of apoptosis 2-like [Dreissena polymorpha]|uniref:RING-type domain-containing protein n=1 Tax=Dreissena polymorpha TaxID=45954 RepID=A0A9D3YYL9_DREPO|nr:death-associated inhibitor of apoptosis 2-like [Dreissena polymorpha]KAH3709528.1 hypothetical protein DPMN_068991 [Dreissena polymorpha]
MNVCGDESQCEGMSEGRVSLKGLQSGVLVEPEEISKVLPNIATKAVHPSDDFHIATSTEACVASARAPSNSSEISSNEYETDYANITVVKQQLPTTPQQPLREQIQQLVCRQHTNFPTFNNLSSLTHTNLCGTSIPKYPTFSTVPQRLKSFGDVFLAVSTQLLSVAGFFLVQNGGEDATRCYHCGIGLRHWSPEDDPWVEHARFSPKCDYLLSAKGQEFVNLIQLAVQYSSYPANATSNKLNQTSSTNMSTLTSSSEHSISKTEVRENAALHTIMKCMYCSHKEVSLVFLPCGHLISCDGCGKEQRNCRMCGSNIKGTVRTFRA